MRKTRNKLRYFKALTLIEVITYLALFAFIFVTIMQFVMTVKETNDHALARSNIERMMIFVMNHFNTSFNVANSIVLDGSSFDNDNGVLQLESVDKLFYYSIDDGQIVFRDNGEYYPITDNKYTVNSLYFEQILNNDDVPVGVRVSLEIMENHDNDVRKNLTTAFLLR